MIVCTNCGNHNEDGDEFCGSCGKFLEWVGQRIETPAPAAVAEPEPAAEPGKVGLVDRVKAAVGIDAAGPEAPDGAPDAAELAAADQAAALEAEMAAAGAAATEQQRLEDEAAEATRRAAQAEEEARRRAEEQAKADAEAEAA